MSFFHVDVFWKRIRTSAETFLLEANARGAEAGRRVYAQVTGLGLGVWLFSARAQREAYIRAFQEAVLLNAAALDKIDVIDFRCVRR